MNYLIAVLPDRIQAEAACSALEKEGLPVNQISIVGKGYKSADEFEFIDPVRQGRKQATLMAYWLVPFGFIAGYSFNVLTSIELFPWAGSLGNHIIGGVFGAIAGVMGSIFTGGGVGLTSGSGDAFPYRNRLQAGKYLVIVSGPPNITNQANRILKSFEPESLQGYVDPTRT
jgi:hypothetical protein